MRNKRIWKETGDNANKIDKRSVSDKQYCVIYAARQALTLAVDERMCAALLEVILGNRI